MFSNFCIDSFSRFFGAAASGLHATGAATYLVDGRAPRPGEVLVQADLAQTYRTIAADGPGAFYRGAIADKIVSFMSDNGGLITAEDLTRYQIEYVVGGTHWPIYVPLERGTVIRDYHRQNMFLATHPFVDIVAHPWWWMGHWMDNHGNYPAEPWFDDFRVIPSSMHREFAAAASEHDTAVEINIVAILLNPHYPERFVSQYLEYLAELKAQRVRLSIGSDCHAAHYDIDFDRTSQMLQSVGITDGFWRLEPRID